MVASIFLHLVPLEVDLPLKKDGFTTEGTTLEALLRGEGLEKKIDTKEEDTLQEIQVTGSVLSGGLALLPISLLLK